MWSNFEIAFWFRLIHFRSRIYLVLVIIFHICLLFVEIAKNSRGRRGREIHGDGHGDPGRVCGGQVRRAVRKYESLVESLNMLKHEYSVVKIGHDTAENEPLKVCQKLAQSLKRVRTESK